MGDDNLVYLNIISTFSHHIYNANLLSIYGMYGIWILSGLKANPVSRVSVKEVLHDPSQWLSTRLDTNGEPSDTVMVQFKYSVAS